MVCIGSIAELEALSGVKVERNGEKDLHRETVDKITIPSKRPGRHTSLANRFIPWNHNSHPAFCNAII